MRSHRGWSPWLGAVALYFLLFVLAVLVNLHGLSGSYYYDDYLRVFSDPNSALWQGFLHANYFDKFYRPLESMVLAFVQMHFGWNTLPLHLLSLSLHTYLACLVSHVLRRWKVRPEVAIGVAAYVIVSQMSTAAVLGNDTQSQITASLCSAGALWLLYRRMTEASDTGWRYAGSVACFFLALISKETSIGLTLSVAFLSFVLMRADTTVRRVQRTIVTLVPYGIATLVYLGLRVHAGAALPQYGTQDYAFRFGANIVENIGELGIQSLLPISSIEFVRALRSHAFDYLAVFALFTLGAFAILARGLAYDQRRGRTLVLVGILICSWCPVLFLTHLNEPYSYNGLPVIAVLWGLSFEQLLRRGSRMWRVLALGAILPLFVGNALGVDQKARAMTAQGKRADVLLKQVVHATTSLPRGANLVLVDPSEKTFKYTTFLLQGFRVLVCADSIIHFLSGRPDVSIIHVQDSTVARLRTSPTTIFLTYEPRSLTLVPYPIPIRRELTGE
ncbi:MAG: hypothetical protein JSS75_03715 [Bacteroidetes bacterium]|nr:hypothetical protein [Bacteroidota bacterium]